MGRGGGGREDQIQEILILQVHTAGGLYIVRHKLYL